MLERKSTLKEPILHPRLHLAASVSKRVRKRLRANGEEVVHVRFVVDYRDPREDRHQIFFPTRQLALEYREQLFHKARRGAWAFRSGNLSLSNVLDHWLSEAKAHVRSSTLKNYQKVHRYIIGPLIEGSARDRRSATLGHGPMSLALVPLLGDVPIGSLSTAQLRQWHNTLIEKVGRRTAKEMKRCLAAALKLAAQDFDIAVPAVPMHAKGHSRRGQKTILTQAQVHRLLQAALQDRRRGIYYAFPFLTGVRPSEQLGLLWDAVDLEAKTVRIMRTQGLDGAIVDDTKTNASVRTVPIPDLLCEMLADWKTRCPKDNQGLGRVFPTLGRIYKNGTIARSGNALTYFSFRSEYWKPALQACGLPYVSPHTARHTYISTLQAAGLEVGLVAKLVGHSNPNVTLTHYTFAVRNGEIAANVLQAMYASKPNEDNEKQDLQHWRPLQASRHHSGGNGS